MTKLKTTLAKVAGSRRFHTTVIGGHAIYFSAGAAGLPGYKFVMAALAVATVIEFFAQHEG